MKQLLQCDRSFPGNEWHGMSASGSNAWSKVLGETKRHWPGWVAPLLATLPASASLRCITSGRAIYIAAGQLAVLGDERH